MANYEKIYDLFDLALWMQETSEGLSLEDIEQKYNVSRRTAEIHAGIVFHNLSF